MKEKKRNHEIISNEFIIYRYIIQIACIYNCVIRKIENVRRGGVSVQAGRLKLCARCIAIENRMTPDRSKEKTIM